MFWIFSQNFVKHCVNVFWKIISVFWTDKYFEIEQKELFKPISRTVHESFDSVITDSFNELFWENLVFDPISIVLIVDMLLKFNGNFNFWRLDFWDQFCVKRLFVNLLEFSFYFQSVKINKIISFIEQHISIVSLFISSSSLCLVSKGFFFKSINIKIRNSWVIEFIPVLGLSVLNERIIMTHFCRPVMNNCSSKFILIILVR